jgi:hypothetical protein
MIGGVVKNRASAICLKLYQHTDFYFFFCFQERHLICFSGIYILLSSINKLSSSSSSSGSGSIIEIVYISVVVVVGSSEMVYQQTTSNIFNSTFSNLFYLNFFFSLSLEETFFFLDLNVKTRKQIFFNF